MLKRMSALAAVMVVLALAGSASAQTKANALVKYQQAYGLQQGLLGDINDYNDSVTDLLAYANTLTTWQASLTLNRTEQQALNDMWYEYSTALAGANSWVSYESDGALLNLSEAGSFITLGDQYFNNEQYYYPGN